MAHFAELDENNIVVRVIVINNEDCGGGNFPESEPIGQEFISSIGLEGVWKQTSYNNNFRKKFAGNGYFYDEENDVFIAGKTAPSFILNEDFEWVPPIPMPETGGPWIWNEEIQEWEGQLNPPVND